MIIINIGLIVFTGFYLVAAVWAILYCMYVDGNILYDEDLREAMKK